MSLNNVPLEVAATIMAVYKRQLLGEIQKAREALIGVEVARYEAQLLEEFNFAIDEHDKTLVIDPTDIPGLEALDVVRNALIAKLTNERVLKLEARTRELQKNLTFEMLELRSRPVIYLHELYYGPIEEEEVTDKYNELTILIEKSNLHFMSRLRDKTKAFLSWLNILNRISPNCFVEPRAVLFSLRSTTPLLITYKPFVKKKRKKYRLKKRRLRKIYALRKLRKIMFFRKLKKRYFVQTLKINMFTKLAWFKSNNILLRRVPVSARVVESTSVEFFYKLNKKRKFDLLEDFEPVEEPVTDLIIFLRNYHQKPYFKFRKARMAHWRLFFNKTLRQQRYKGFLARFVKKYDKLSYALSYLLTFFTKVKLSWTRYNRVESFLKLYLVEYTQNVVRLPFIFSNFFKWNVLKRRNWVLRKKLGRWSYLNYRRAVCPWLQRKKRTPKIGYHTQPNFQYLNVISYWDFMTGFIYLGEKLPLHSLPPLNQFKANLLVRLHMYRYKANNRCMLH